MIFEPILAQGRMGEKRGTRKWIQIWTSKNANAKNKQTELVLFEMRGGILKVWRVQRIGGYHGIVKMSDKHVIHKIVQSETKETEHEQISIPQKTSSKKQ